MQIESRCACSTRRTRSQGPCETSDMHRDALLRGSEGTPRSSTGGHVGRWRASYGDGMRSRPSCGICACHDGGWGSHCGGGWCSSSGVGFRTCGDWGIPSRPAHRRFCHRHCGNSIWHHERKVNGSQSEPSSALTWWLNSRVRCGPGPETEGIHFTPMKLCLTRRSSAVGMLAAGPSRRRRQSPDGAGLTRLL